MGAQPRGGGRRARRADRDPRRLRARAARGHDRISAASSSASVGEPALAANPGHLLAFAAFFIVMLAETGRLPVDNPATHLELTMIHEAMVLEYSGRYLALVEWAGGDEALPLHDAAGEPVLPVGRPRPRGAPCRIAARASRAGRQAGGPHRRRSRCSRPSVAKLRLFRVPELLAGSFALALLSVTRGVPRPMTAASEPPGVPRARRDPRSSSGGRAGPAGSASSPPVAAARRPGGDDRRAAPARPRPRRCVGARLPRRSRVVVIPRVLARIGSGTPVRPVAPGRSSGITLLVAGALVVVAYVIMLPRHRVTAAADRRRDPAGLRDGADRPLRSA